MIPVAAFTVTVTVTVTVTGASAFNSDMLEMHQSFNQWMR